MMWDLPLQKKNTLTINYKSNALMSANIIHFILISKSIQVAVYFITGNYNFKNYICNLCRYF